MKCKGKGKRQEEEERTAGGRRMERRKIKTGGRKKTKGRKQDMWGKQGERKIGEGDEEEWR